MDSEQKRLFLAVALSAVVLFGWQAFFGPRVQQNTQDGGGTEAARVDIPLPQRSNQEVRETRERGRPETEKVELSAGGTLLRLDSDLTVTDYRTELASFSFNEVVGSPRAFEFYLINAENMLEKLSFTLTKGPRQGSLQGRNEKHGIDLRIQIMENAKAAIHLLSPLPLRYRIQLNSTAAQMENRQYRQFISFSQDVETYDLNERDSADNSFRWFGIDFNYHLFAVVFPERMPLRLATGESGFLTADIPNPLRSLQFDLLFTRKDYDLLESFGSSLNMAVDFGIFGVLGVPILRGLQWIYSYIPNYGVGIILLTLFMRIITFPLQYKSFKSMKKMQVLGPELQKLKEKFKNDPQRMQQETMSLFKRSGANPLGGCFPLLLQMPILFAFYQVLYGAVELVGAPFLWHITDLSVKDPLYILPILCTLSMFLNQKLTPMATATDPMQKKIMAFLPFVFGFIMMDLPSGLVLYIVVSTLFGIGQQLLVYKMTD